MKKKSILLSAVGKVNWPAGGIWMEWYIDTGVPGGAFVPVASE